jgi:hypothetical protein
MRWNLPVTCLSFVEKPGLLLTNMNLDHISTPRAWSPAPTPPSTATLPASATVVSEGSTTVSKSKRGWMNSLFFANEVG